MRDLVRELEAMEDARSTTWSPAPGEILVGRVVGYDTITGQYSPCRAAIVEREDGSGRVTVWLSALVLQDLFAKQQPEVGEQIGLRYLGKHPAKGYKRFALIVDRGARPAERASPSAGVEDDPFATD
jgi:hypothetical protein